MRGLTRQQQAVKIREAALIILKTAGEWSIIDGPHGRRRREVTARVGHFEISHDTPFTGGAMGNYDRRFRAFAAGFGLSCPDNKGYGLNIWDIHKKVANLSWNDGAKITIVSLRPGPWQQELISLADRMRK